MSRWFPSVEWLEDRLLLTSPLDYLAKDATPVALHRDSNVLEIVTTSDSGTVLASKTLSDIHQRMVLSAAYPHCARLQDSR